VFNRSEGLEGLVPVEFEGDAVCLIAFSPDATELSGRRCHTEASTGTPHERHDDANDDSGATGIPPRLYWGVAAAKA
jgi:hypothetical protein